MQLNKRDITTIVLLSVLFFAVATWNLGFATAPYNSFQETEKRTFYVELDEAKNVSSVYFFVKRGNATVSVYRGEPGNWNSIGEITLKGDSTWCSLTVKNIAKYFRFVIKPGVYESRPNFYWSVPNPTDVPPRPFIEVAEIVILDQENHQIQIVEVKDETNVNGNLSLLFDEQKMVNLPSTYMSQTYFDEVYFVRAAQDYLHFRAPFERTHPPLGKLIQASSIAVFGDTPFGWRIMGVLFATLMIPIIYVMGKKLFGTWIGSFSAAFLLTFDFMHFTMARMGTADTYVVFFALASQLCFLAYFINVIKKGWRTSVLPLFLAVVFFALGFSTKWLTLYAALGMLALLVAFRLREVFKLKGSLGTKYVAFFDYPFLLLLGLVGVVAAIYFVTYIPDMLIGNSFSDIIKLQFEMYNFHSTLTATHSYMSPWWSWPIMVSPQGYVPLWLSISYLPNNVHSTISVFGNPAVWWVGFACMFIVAERAIRGKETAYQITRWIRKRVNKKTEETTVESETTTEKANSFSEQTLENTGRKWSLAAIFIATMFFCSWVPYVFISRATFIYHFYISVPFLCFATAYVINQQWKTKGGKIFTVILFASVVALFVLFYPVISGTPADASWIEKLRLFPSWYF
ncbi:MAG: glycosyltransferase family 39 protein [Candidatus Bathyarchaeota archaeon]|nr:glycosyltransferase family 39 protein [Candidatus Bathyarchaeota archaeon]